MCLCSRCRDSFGLQMLSCGFLHNFVLRTRWLWGGLTIWGINWTTNKMSKASLQNCAHDPESITKVFIGLQVFVKKILLGNEEHLVSARFEATFLLKHHDVTSKTPHSTTTAYNVRKLRGQTQWNSLPAFSLCVLIICRPWRWAGIPGGSWRSPLEARTPGTSQHGHGPGGKTGGSGASEGWGEGSCRKECSPSRNWFN